MLRPAKVNGLGCMKGPSLGGLLHISGGWSILVGDATRFTGLSVLLMWHWWLFLASDVARHSRQVIPILHH